MSLTPTCPFCQFGMCTIHVFEPSPVKIFDISNQRSPRLDLSEISPRRGESNKRGGILVAGTGPKFPNPYRKQSDDVSFIQEALGIRLGKSKWEIPRIIHRFWTGGPLREPVFEALMREGQRAISRGWQCFLWHSSSVEELLDQSLDTKIEEANSFSILFWKDRPKSPKDLRPVRVKQRKALEKIGYTILPIETLFKNPWSFKLAKRAGAQAVLGNWDDVKYFSDLARLAYLFKVGGFHMDVDIGLGDMDLDCRYYHNDDEGCIPLMGSLIRDLQDPLVEDIRLVRAIRNSIFVSFDDLRRYQAAINRLVTQAKNAAGMLNALIASRQGTSHIQSAIHAYAQSGQLISGMTLARNLLFGKSREGDLDLALALTVPPYVLRLEPDTEESNL
ncbi:hypothetical protein ACNOYE_02195 [Nannocystaceae bacterium ST9]